MNQRLMWCPILFFALAAGCDKKPQALSCDKAIPALLYAIEKERSEEAREIYEDMRPECIIILRGRVLSAGPNIWHFVAVRQELIDEELFCEALASGNAEAVHGALTAFDGKGPIDWITVLETLNLYWDTYNKRNKTAVLVFLHVRPDYAQWSTASRTKLAQLLVKASESKDGHHNVVTYKILRDAFDLTRLSLFDDSATQDTKVEMSIQFLRQGAPGIERAVEFAPGVPTRYQ